MNKNFEILGREYKLESEAEIGTELYLERSDSGISYLKLKLDFGGSVIPKKVSISYDVDAVDMYNMWDPMCHERGLGIRWGKTETPSRLAGGMPIKQLLSRSGKNRYLVAVSDVKSPLCIAMGASERRGVIEVRIDFFTNITGPFDKYEATLRIDERDIPFDSAIQETRDWYGEIGYRASVAPNSAKEPMYSTWYSLWQTMTAQEVLRECRHAVKLGMKTVIIDDGWQKAVPGRIYEFVGDWVPEKRRFGDLERLVPKLHAMGLNVMLWFSIAYVGHKAKNYKRFEGKYLCDNPAGHYSVLDPRYKEVRDFLIDTYVDAVKKYDLDGLKIDFVDRFNSNGKIEDGMDFSSVEDATEQLLIDITSALKAIKPNMLIEFRQPYFGPVISSYGNMIRVWDCPLNSVVNKNATIDLRLVSSSCAVHSDMIYWSKNDTPENVATQLWSTLLSVPQISNLYSDTTPEQRRVLKSSLDFWMAHKEAIMNGKLHVTLSENGYGYATVSEGDKKISLAICEAYFDSSDGYAESYMVNLTGKDKIILKANKGSFVEIFDCQGRRIGNKKKIRSTLSEISVPHAARIRVTEV